MSLPARGSPSQSRKRRTRISKSVFVLAAAAVVVTACSDPVPPTVPRMTRESGLTPSLSGTLHVVWGDPRGGRDGRATTYLSDVSGRMTLVVLPENLRGAFGYLQSLDGHRVTAIGDLTPAADASMNPVFR